MLRGRSCDPGVLTCRLRAGSQIVERCTRSCGPTRRSWRAAFVLVAIRAVFIGLAFGLLANAARAQLAEKPVLGLLFEDDLADTSDSQEAAAANGAVRFVDGRRGRCVSLDGRTWIDTLVAQKDLGSKFTVECKYYPLIDDIAPLGFEEVMIDVAWWRGGSPIRTRSTGRRG